MTLIVIKDDGKKDCYTDVLTFDYYDKEYIQNVAESMGKKITDGQIQEVGKILSDYDSFPESGDVYNEVQHILCLNDGGIF